MSSALSSEMNEEACRKVAAWLRKPKNLECGEGLLFRKRVDYFTSEDIVEVLKGEDFTAQKFFSREMKGEEIDELCARLMQLRLFFRGVITNLDTADLDDLDKIEQHPTQMFLNDDDEIYVWILPQSKRDMLYKVCGYMALLLFCTMIKIWPIWLKICVWWVSLIMLICMLSLIVLRLVLYVFMTMLGFKGIWLLPNLLNDDIDFMDAFSPLFGKGIDMKHYMQVQREKVADRRRRRAKAVREEREKKRAEKRARDKKKNGEEGEVDNKEPECDEPLSEDEVWKMGLRNVGIFMILAMIICNYFGLFSGDNIPEFVISQVDLWKEFPSLAPPDFDVEKHEEEEEAKKKKGKGPSLDDLLKEEEEDVEDEEVYNPVLDKVEGEDDDEEDLDLPDVPDDEDEEEEI